MNSHPFTASETVPTSTVVTRGRAWFCALTLLAFTFPSLAAERQYLHHQISVVATNMVPIRHSSRWDNLKLTIGLPLRDQEGLTNLLQQLYDPASINYHRFLTPAEFAERFGPTEQDYQAVVSFAQSHGLIVTGRHSNRTLVSVSGRVADVERVFHVMLNEYQHPTEARTFYAPDTEPSIDLAVPILAVGGLDNYVIPHPCLKPLAAGQAKSQLTGSGPGGTYMGNDFRAAYVPGVPQMGTGQTVGLLEFDSGYHQSDITTYEALTGLPNVPVSAVLLDGYNGGPGGGNDEVSLDIEMAISMAPGLSGVIVYEGSATDDILNRMATDDAAKQIGASWTYSIDAESEQIFLQYAAQGQSFFNASGDSDAYAGVVPTPSDDPNITVVGGTTLTTTGPGGAWDSETVWNWGGGTGSSGGISTVYSIPSWQQGISMAANQGSTTMRNLPDVAMTADNVYVVYGGGQAGSFGGTSCATPLWAAFTALMNQLALTNGEPTVGFINPAVYAIGKGSNFLSYRILFHDITTGNNENSSNPTRFLAVGGYDLCTGWGTPAGSNLMMAIAVPEPLRITPAGGVIFTGPVGGPFGPTTQTFTLSDTAAGSVTWSLANTSAWFNVSPESGTLQHTGPSGVVTASLAPADTNLPAGSYSAELEFTNVSDKFVQTRLLTLAVVTPPVITSQPTNQALLDGMTASFSVGTGSNALMFYQWQKNGVNLTDVGGISGSATSALTISNVFVDSIGTYSVVLTNAAGGLASSNASLTIVPSAPVIVLQPTNQTVLPDAPASFSVAVVGNTPYVYHWMLNGTNLANNSTFSGVTGNFLTVSSVSAANAGTYTVSISNTLGSVTSTGAVLSLVPVTVPGLTMSLLGSLAAATSGEFSYSSLAQGNDGNLYGTGFEGGADGDGTIYRITTNGVLGTLLPFNYTDGALPYGGLVLGKSGLLYGTTFLGGTYGDGTSFAISTGGVLSRLATFDGVNGEDPVCGMMQGSDGNFYGTTEEGGAYGYGTIYRINPNGVVTVLVSFNYTDGGYPSSVLVQGNDGNLYGTAEEGGPTGWGAVFKLTPAGTFTVLHSFGGGNDGGIPIAGLVQATDGNFYGTTYEEGTNGYGTVFEMTPMGEVTTLYAFTGGMDGGNPWGGLVQATDGNLYGTAATGGTYGDGTVFRVAPTGLLAPVAQFDGYSGANPLAALIQGKDGNLYGTTEGGGLNGDGAIYRISIGGPLQITGQPADQSVYIGGTAVFNVATFGAAPVFYQWQQNGINLTNGGNISGANTATLRITSATTDDAAVYSVVVSNAFNSVTSDYAVLDVMFSPPSITSQPASVTCVVGMAAVFTVGAQGDQPLTYQWLENGTNLTDGGTIFGSATSSLTITNVSMANAGSYSVIVSNALFTVSSSHAALTVVAATPPSAVSASLHVFSGGIDGAFPYGGVIQGSDGNLYGTAEGGGADYYGTVYRATLSGAVTTLYTFADGATGGNPYGSLVQVINGNFYGTTADGGTNGYGTLFRITGGSFLTSLYSFADGSDGGDPLAGLGQGSDGNFYGTAYEGGANDYGTVFRMASNGAVTALHEFSGETDGADPHAGLIQGRDGKFYGTTTTYGPGDYGTVFSLTANGTLTTLAAFNYLNGGDPQAGVIQGTDGRLYGTTFEGGTNGDGTVFCVTTNGTLTTLFSFGFTNGANPAAALVQGTDGNLYGTTSTGGAGGQGTAFRITTNGVLTTLLWFDGANGADPESALVQASDGNFYGTTAQGGPGNNPSAGGGNGLIFRITVPIFIKSSNTMAAAIACLPYTSSISNLATAPVGDGLTFAKVSGPAWLIVATNGVLLGTPTNSDIGTNTWVVSLTDSNGVYASANLTISVVPDPAPIFSLSIFSEPWANVDEDYSATIATNVVDAELGHGEILTFTKLSGPGWLNVAANGQLSGTPDDINGGTNIFIVSVANLGGYSNIATLWVYVNSPPSFILRDFTTPAATVGLPYSGTIATNATDPDLGAGDILTFYKVVGPTWLNVGTNGTLSGAPASANLGANSFLMLVVDSGGLSAIGNLNITVNADSPPVFISNPFSGPPVTAGQPYLGSIAANASDPDFGDVLTFSKVSGPAWLSLASNGSLSGTPFSSNVGTNAFIVSVTDYDGLSNNATLYVDVISAAAIVATISPANANLKLSWTGGIAPYQVWMTTNLNSAAWQNVGSPTSLTNLMLAPSNAGAFYRIQGQ